MRNCRVPCLILLLLGCACAAMGGPPATAASLEKDEWPNFGRDPGATRYSPLDQIDASNVSRLKRVWKSNTGRDAGIWECTPLMVNGRLFLITGFSDAIALDAANGNELWRYQPTPDPGRGATRGVAYWSDGEKERVILPVRDGRIVSLDAATGKPDAKFGDGGTVDLRALLGAGGRDLYLTSPPSIYKDLILQGFMVPDSHSQYPPPLPFVALDAHTGKLVWTFNTVPQGDEFGTETWENGSWRGRGGANIWSRTSVDTARGIVYLPVSTPKFDFFGGDRPGSNLFGESIVALDANTGKRLWHFQILHHGLWDYDLAISPALVDLRIAGETVPAVAQITKNGFAFLFNRVTGEPIFEIQERPVPASDVPGESAWPTQPFPTKPPPFSKQGFFEEDLSDIDPETHAYVLKNFKKYRSGEIYTPPSLQGTILMPGTHGGGNWGGVAIDPQTGWLYTNATNLSTVIKLKKSPPGHRYDYLHLGYPRFRDQNGYPGNKPPWGELVAIDLAKGVIAWKKPLGEFEELTKKGVPVTGQENFGGPMVTAGGLVFIASTMDEYLRAFDKKTGEVLFKAKLDFGGYATPITYAVDGKQYVVICAGGGGKMKTPSGDAVIAFALR